MDIRPGRWLILLLRVCFSVGLEIKNGIVGTPSISCLDDRIQLTFATQHPFRGRIFVKGRSDDPNCTKDYSAGTSAVSSDPGNYVIALGDCGMQRLRSLTPQGMQMQITVVISFHPIFVTKVDRAYRLQCVFRSNNRVVTQSLDVSMIATTALTGGSEALQGCTYSLHTTDQNGPILRFAAVGDKVVHVWECDAGGSANLGIFISNCETRDEGGQQNIPIVDDKGCPIDPILLDKITYDTQKPLAFATSHVYKYADKSSIYFVCSVKICNRQQGECDINPNCSLPPRYFRQRAKRRAESGLDLSTDELVVFESRTLAGLRRAANISEPTANPSWRNSSINYTSTSSATTIRTISTTEPTATPLEFGGVGDLPVCLSPAVFAVMAVSTLLAFLLATLLAAVGLIRLVAQVYADTQVRRLPPPCRCEKFRMANAMYSTNSSSNC